MGLFDGVFGGSWPLRATANNRDWPRQSSVEAMRALSETSRKCIAAEKERWGRTMQALREDTARTARQQRLETRRAERRLARRIARRIGKGI